jgi:HlyD family secretion protein
LHQQAAATAQQVERAEREVAVLADEVTGAKAAARSLAAEVAAIRATGAQANDRKRRAIIASPATGTVLVRSSEPGEYVQQGTPLFTVAALDTLIFRAYVSGADLNQVGLGSLVHVRVDVGADSLRMLPGRVTWVASAAEFTPTPIQTRDERTTQVYAVKVAVANVNGTLRIGMPGELLFAVPGPP